MSRSFLLPFLFVASIAFAQGDLTFHVVKRDTLSIYPDSMYMSSHISRIFTIGGIPSGYRAKGSFTGGDLHIHNNMLTLTPCYVYKESAVTALDRKYFPGFKTVSGDYYTAELKINVFDGNDKLVSFLSKKVYIKYEDRRKAGVHRLDEFIALGANGILGGTKDSGQKNVPVR